MKSKANVFRILALLMLMAAIVWTRMHRAQFHEVALESRLRNLGWWAPAAFIAYYALATALFFPGSLLTLLGGAIFGPLWGTLWNLCGATVGAGLAFLIARYTAADWIRRMAGARLNRLLAGVEEEGWRFVAFVRLVPLFPFNLLNYALGLTKIDFTTYLLTSAICMIPGALAYTWLGYAGRQAAAGDAAAIRSGMLAIALVAAVTFAARLLRRRREQNGSLTASP
jgi:uncharacterized membrane protein YdjX (TVP38/TMEM64 family)